MRRARIPIALAGLAFLAAAPQHFDVTARYVPPSQAGRDGAIAVSFAPRDPDVRVNQEPAPRLKLDPAQDVLVDRQPAPATGEAAAYDPATARYLDPGVPVHFPVVPAAGAPRGTHAVKATVTYFYCSKREGWCRKGTAPIEVAVALK